MKRYAVLNVVGLTKKLIGEHTPFISNLLKHSEFLNIKPSLPAVTCTVQSSMLTGLPPEKHGIVANGWYFKDVSEVMFWKQSNKLVSGEKIWETAKKIDPNFTAAINFWWYNMYSSVDYSVTPRPIYKADGRKIPDIYANKKEIYDHMHEKLGRFPLFEFWGPNTSIRSSAWIADCALEIEKKYAPTLNLVYLPHLDYCLQIYGNDMEKIAPDLQDIDKVVERLYENLKMQEVECVIVSEYGMNDVNNPIYVNRLLRKMKLLAVREEEGTEILDPGASEAFAVCDHQLAHIYIKSPGRLEELKQVFLDNPDIDLVLDKSEQKEQGIAHERSGDLVLVSKKNSWFCYYYWLDNLRAPDFARTVDIHRKPGYDPVELFLNPDLNFAKLKIVWKLLQKKLGFRTLLDVIPLKPELVKGSHGRLPDSPDDAPVLIAPNLPESMHQREFVQDTELKQFMLDLMFKQDS